MSEINYKLEIEIRGSTLKVAITIERLLMMIVYTSNAEQYTIKNSEYLRLKNLTFGGKLNRVKKVLDKFHPDLLASNIVLFEKLDRFKTFRDKMAHCAFEWNYSQTGFNILDNVEDENGFQYYESFPCKVIDTKKATLEGTLLVKPLLEIANEVELRLKNQHPLIAGMLKLE